VSLLTICTDVAQDTPIAAPSTIVGNTSSDAQLLLACAQRAGEALARYKSGGWDEMIKEFDFPTLALSLTGNVQSGSAVVTSVSSTAGLSATIFAPTGPGIPSNALIQSVDSGTQFTMTLPATASTTGAALVVAQWAYALPADFQRTITDTEWDRSRRWPLVGPRSPQQWQLYKSGLIGTATFQRRWRIKQLTVSGVAAKYFCLDPVPTDNGAQMVFEYVSNAWCQSAAGTPQTRWAADTDTGILDEYLLTLGVRWRFLNRLGLAYAEELDEYLRETAKAFGADGGMPILDLAGGDNNGILIGPWNVPDQGFGGVIG